MSNTKTQMAQELSEAPLAIVRQEPALAQPLAGLAARLQRRPPQVVVTCARGSSAHAAAFGKHLIERYAGIPVARRRRASPASMASRCTSRISWCSPSRSRGAATTSSPSTASAKDNRARSPSPSSTPRNRRWPQTCEFVLPICAGPELSVAATKTFIATAAALLGSPPHGPKTSALEAAIGRLPERLASAAALDWSAAVPALRQRGSLVTMGRGSTLAIAREAALKLKETCNLHAEAFSGAEFLHGPVALVSSRYPILMFMPTDAAAPGMRQLAGELRRMGTALFIAEHGRTGATRLPALRRISPRPTPSA